MDRQEKVRENLLRRMAERQGLELIKSRSRDPLAADYGLYGLRDPRTGGMVNPHLANRRPCAWALDDVEDYLTRPPTVTDKEPLSEIEQFRTRLHNAILDEKLDLEAATDRALAIGKEMDLWNVLARIGAAREVRNAHREMRRMIEQACASGMIESAPAPSPKQPPSKPWTPGGPAAERIGLVVKRRLRRMIESGMIESTGDATKDLRAAAAYLKKKAAATNRVR